jgi:hypothetical protein
MSRRATTLGLLSIAGAVFLLAVLVHAHSSVSNERKEINAIRTAADSDGPAARVQNERNNIPDARSDRNLSLQPEAIKLLRRIGGSRFRLKTPPAFIMDGVLTTGSDREEIQVSRSQDTRGERVKLVLSRGTKSLSWETAEGARNSKGTLGLTDSHDT